ncbi:kinase-like protein [Tilletiaria anomala UBC 951]|uniref:Kinase-like protein n=1 Tax=Tilletiaria anomala (strain ATCC 24038 / CBS 436.72 / UBC 951) TaxID=1037660 RepID=A0A066WPT6_TILAU|nr:kinase-like protein [Tilletiaria anomala UBC 951]KDN53014.1 kinase-like protein [Tilletiaria anomala UBC 951]
MIILYQHPEYTPGPRQPLIPSAAEPASTFQAPGGRRIVHKADGRSSCVYRYWPNHTVLLAASESGNECACIKRVTLEDQPRPHDVKKEVAFLRRMKSAWIPTLLAAVEEEVDFMTTTVSLLMPWFEWTLDDVLNDSSTLPSSLRAAARLPPLSASPQSGAGNDQPRTLAQYVNQAQSLSHQLFSALAYLHDEARVAHRDIKPSNIVLARKSSSSSPSFCNEYNLKLIDFGTAENLSGCATSSTSRPSTQYLHANASPDDSTSASSRRSMTAQLGTTVFRAPELLFAPKDGYDATKVDIWGAGCIVSMFFTAFVGVVAHASGEDAGGDSASISDDEADPSWRSSRDSPDFKSPFGRVPDSPKGSEDTLELDKIGQSPSFSSEVDKPRVSFKRKNLFHLDFMGEIPLAASIFQLKGLPEQIADWPEAQSFQPPLSRMPFRRSAAEAIWTRLPIAAELIDSSAAGTATRHSVQLTVEGVERCTALSASMRPRAHDLAQLLDRD